MKGISLGRSLSVSALLLACLSNGSPAVMAQQTAPAGGLRVGAARVDITPPAPEGNRIRDRLFANAIVIDNGTTRAALIGADQISFGEQAWADVTKRIAAEFKIPIEHVLTSATHTHSDGRFGVAAPLGAATGRGAAPPPAGRAAGAPPAQVAAVGHRPRPDEAEGSRHRPCSTMPLSRPCVAPSPSFSRPASDTALVRAISTSIATQSTLRRSAGTRDQI